MRWKTKAALILALAVVPLAAGADWVRDEVYVHLRSGPGLEYRILKVLKSGDVLTRLSESDDWIQVQPADGESGWVPKDYLVTEAPPSIALPEAQAQLGQAKSRIEALESKLASQEKLLGEAESLRKRSTELQEENARLIAASTWKSMATGAGIMLLGALIGLLIPRGGASRTRLKL